MTAPPTIAVPLHSHSNRRISERYVAAMPVHIEGEVATTQDLSAHGLSFLTDRRHELGDKVKVTIEYLLDGHNYPLDCEVEVVRVEAVPEGFSIGARLTPQSQLVDIAVPAEPAAAWPSHLRPID